MRPAQSRCGLPCVRGSPYPDQRLETASPGEAAERLAESSLPPHGPAPVPVPCAWRNASGLGWYVGHRQRFGDHRALPGKTRSRVSNLAGPIIINSRSFDDGVNVVAIGHRIFHPPQRHYTGAAAEHGSVGVNIKRPAVSIARVDAVFLKEVPCVSGTRSDDPPARARSVSPRRRL